MGFFWGRFLKWYDVPNGGVWSATGIYISPIAVKIFSTETINIESIEILYKDGTKEEVVNVEKRIGLGSSSQSYTLSENTETYIFSDLKDIEQIESIIYNGEKTVK